MIDGFVKDTSKNPHRRKIVSGQVHQRSEKARTLMRDGLKKPVRTLGNGVEHFGGAVNIQRQMRAKITPKHSHVDRFGAPKTPSQKKPGPKPLSGELVSRRPQQNTANQTTHKPMPSMVTSVSHQKLERMLDQALTHADSHKEQLRYQAARHFWHRRLLSGHRRWYALMGLMLLIVAVAFISWQRFPQFSIKAAGMKAHIAPTVPGYIPEGYKLAGPAKAISGTVDIKYARADNTADYEVVQTQSALTSSLVGQNVVPKGAPVQTTQVEGNTVFIYGRHNDAAWVNNGILYTIKDHADLNSDELIKIVQGLNP
jgi:hypothetical protein